MATCNLKHTFRETTVAEFFGSAPFQVVDGSEISPGLCIIRACVEPAILYLHEYAAEKFRTCVDAGNSLDWVLDLPVDWVLSCESVAVSASFVTEITMKNDRA